MAEGNSMKIASIAAIAIIAVLVVTGVNLAHAYNSSLTGTATVDADVLSIVVIDDSDNQSWTTESPELSFSLPSSGSDSAYCIRVFSNLTTSAFVYGYFSCESEKPEGIAVKSVTLDFDDGTFATLYRDAYDGTFNRSKYNTEVATDLELSDNYYRHDYNIITMTVNYYPGTGPDKTILWNGEEVETDEALDISDFKFHFLASRQALLS